jgi:hypothetical protein
MNYINRLQSERAENALQAREMESQAQGFLAYLSCAKFSGVDSNGQRKDWISTGEVQNLLISLRNSASALAQDLERK